MASANALTHAFFGTILACSVAGLVGGIYYERSNRTIHDFHPKGFHARPASVYNIEKDSQAKVSPYENAEIRQLESEIRKLEAYETTSAETIQKYERKIKDLETLNKGLKNSIDYLLEEKTADDE